MGTLIVLFLLYRGGKLDGLFSNDEVLSLSSPNGGVSVAKQADTNRIESKDSTSRQPMKRDTSAQKLKADSLAAEEEKWARLRMYSSKSGQIFEAKKTKKDSAKLKTDTTKTPR